MPKHLYRSKLCDRASLFVKKKMNNFIRLPESLPTPSALFSLGHLSRWTTAAITYLRVYFDWN